MTDVASNLVKIQERIVAAAQRSGRDAGAVTLVAVSKTWDTEHIQKAINAGQIVFGENKLQEGQVKVPELGNHLEWHFIGGLQRNKVRKVLGLFDCVHSIDSLRLATHTDKVAADMGLKPCVLLQVNIGAEMNKGGFGVDVIREQFADIIALQHIKIVGLMCIPPVVSEPSQARPFFKAMVQLRAELEKEHAIHLPELSMGMSGDFEIAIEEGATIVRVGSSIFGTRQPVTHECKS